MASIVVYIELRGGAVTRPSRFAVAEARRVADRAGATVYALFTVGPLAQTAIDQIAAEVSAAGADRILCSSAEALAGPALDVTHGVLVAQVAAHLRPLLFLFPAGGTGSELGSPLAVRIGAAYLPNASIDIVADTSAGEPPQERVLLSRWRAAGDAQRRVDVGDLEHPVVASLACGSAPSPRGAPYAEVEMLPYPESSRPGPQLLSAMPDPAAAAELASALVWSATPFDLASVVPPGAADGVTLVVADALDASVLEGAAPAEVFLLSTLPAREARTLALLAPAARMVPVSAKTEASS
jgi:hypothetical protein